jgi:hypothetical protein
MALTAVEILLPNGNASGEENLLVGLYGSETI